MSKTALIAVDVQNDYLPGGAVGFPGSDSVIGPLLEIATQAAIVIASRNLRPPDHKSFDTQPDDGTWPPNCVKGTKGAAIVPSIAQVADYVITKSQTREMGGFTAFEAGTLRPLKSLEDILQEEEITHIAVGGYWLEWCVGQTAFDANALGYSTVVNMGATQTFNIGEVTRADKIARLQRAGVVCV